MIIEHEADTPIPANATWMEQVEDILRRYPKVTGTEFEVAEAFLADAPILQRGLLSSRPGMQAKMEQLRADRPGKFKPSLLGYFVVALGVLTFVALCFLMADIG